jgi:hypothetical protein
MTTECEFDHVGYEGDFTGDFAASADQDYITHHAIHYPLFICHKGQDCDKEAVGKNKDQSSSRTA